MTLKERLLQELEQIPDTIDYNCVAWAAEEEQVWWWPDAQNIDYWPPNIVREETLAAFVEAYKTLGYGVCESGVLEPGFLKIAIYVNSSNCPTHVARQLSNGGWTSKLGSYEDIEHSTLAGLEGAEPAYGVVACFMAKQR
ncbi:MAG: hypothetical protein F6K47_07285 [Symploca sp. SIO2E6]|nr:hypothetical protein [Symploca sp. SIO2E6]